MTSIFLTHGYFLEEDEKEKLILKPYPPLGILSISAYLEANGYPNYVFDSTFSSFAKLCAALVEAKPGIIGIYTNLMTRLNVLRILAFIRENEKLADAFVVLGGPEIRNNMQHFLEHGADALVPGEGEETMLELVKRLDKGQDGRREDILQGAEGVVFQQQDGTLSEMPRTMLRDLDKLPAPARKNIDLQKYLDTWKSKHGYSAINVSTMRGCPYTCRWCSRAVYGQSYRRRSPQRVAEELQELQRDYSFDIVWFVDDVFTISYKWMSEFAAALKERKISVRYECITRADRLNEEVFALLRETGCFRVWIGAESGSQRIIDAMDRRVDVKQVRAMIRMAREYGIEAGTFIMLGYPGETEADIEETITHLIESDPDLYTITVAYPIRGTPLFEEVEAGFTKILPWEKSTDRDLDFKRTYPRKYYDYALRRLYNEVAWHKAIKSGRKKYSLKIKSLAALGAMKLVRLIN